MTVDLLNTLPQGMLTQDRRQILKPIDEYLYDGMAIFAVVDNAWTPLELYYLLKELNELYMLNMDDEDVYQDMCQEYDPRVIRGYRLKLCGGPWQYSGSM